MSRDDISIPGLFHKKQADLTKAASDFMEQMNNGSMGKIIETVKWKNAESLVKQGWKMDSLNWWRHPRNPGARFTLSAALFLQNKLSAHSHKSKTEEPETDSPQKNNS